MKSTYIRQSESYPKYHLIRRDDGLHVALKASEDFDDGDGYFSVGQIMDEENFETACDNAEEESRILMEQARQEFGL